MRSGDLISFNKKLKKLKEKGSKKKCKICKQPMELYGFSAYPNVCRRCACVPL